MKLIVKQDCPIFLSMYLLWQRGESCEAAARTWILENLYQEMPFSRPEKILWGGIDLVRFPMKRNARAQDWTYLSSNPHGHLYRPKSEEILEQLRGLPVVAKAELAELLGYGRYPGPRGINTVPGVSQGDDYFLISVPSFVRGYEAPEGVQEILGSEYNRLFDEAEAWRNQKTETDA